MAYTQQDLDNIDRAIASGQLEVKYDGMEVKYRSIDDLKKARQVILDSLLGGQGRIPASMAVTNMNY